MLELLSKVPVQKVLITGTLPVRMETLLLFKVFLNHDPPTHIVIRAPTLRPELAHHVVKIPSDTPSTVSSYDITTYLANTLLGFLCPGERMVIFVMSVADADALSGRLGCAKYYSALGENAVSDKDEKATNHTEWINGQSVIMVATPALIQGIDYPHVRFVIFHGGAYGLISYYQGAGRGGRSGSQCDVFTIRDERCKLKSRERTEDIEALAEWDEFATTTSCRLRVITSCFDGHELNCSTIPDQLPCDICHPDDKFHDLALAAITAITARQASGKTSQGGVKKRVASPSLSEELLWNNLPSSLNPEDYAYAEDQAVKEYGRKRPRFDQAPATPSQFGSSPFHSSIFRPASSLLSRRTAGSSFSHEPEAEQEYGRKRPGLGQVSASASSSIHSSPFYSSSVSSSIRSSPFYSSSASSTIHSSSFYSSPSPLHKTTASIPSSHKLEYRRKEPRSDQAIYSPFCPPHLTPSASLSATPIGMASTSVTSQSQRGDIGKAILRGASENSKSDEEKRYKSEQLNDLMPILQGICPICFILTGTRVKSLPIGQQEGSGHRPFYDCGLPVSFKDFTTFRDGIILRTPYFYCFRCTMPQSKGGNRLEPKIHTDWWSSCRRTKLKDGGSITCPWSNIVQASVFAIFFDPATMNYLQTHFNCTNKKDWEKMSLDEWCKWLCTDLHDQGEYWKGLEVFLFMMARYGLTRTRA